MQTLGYHGKKCLKYVISVYMFMQLAAAGRIGATKYIFTVFLKGK